MASGTNALVVGGLVMASVAFVGFAAILAGQGVFAADDDGCVRYGPPVRADGIGHDAATSGGSGDFTLRIRIAEGPDGPPVPGAFVTIHHGRSPRLENADPAELPPEGGALALAKFRTHPPSAAATETIRLTAGEDGMVEARLFAGRVFGVVAGANAFAGLTSEWAPATRAGEAGESRLVVMPLYRRHPSMEVQDVWEGPVATGFAQVQWRPHPFPSADASPAARAGYAERLLTLHAEVRWQTLSAEPSGATGPADLGLGLGPTEAEPSDVHDDARDVGPGERYQRVDYDDFSRAGLGGPQGLYIGPTTSTGFAAPQGLRYVLSASGNMPSPGDPFSECGGSGGSVGGGIGGGSGGGGGGGGGGGSGGSIPGPTVPLLLVALVAVAALRHGRAARPPRGGA